VLGKAKAPLSYVSHAPIEDAAALLEAACAKAAEGLVVKRLAAPYTARRTSDWLKVKCGRRQEVILVGFTAPRGARQGLGALLLAVNDRAKLRYAGKVGTGFDARTLQDLARRLKPLIVKTPAVTPAPKMKNVTWVKPVLVAEVAFAEWTGDGSMRHPSFIGLREDKAARDVHEEKPVQARKTSSKGPEDSEVGGVRISHPNRVIDAASGVTKLELAEYYLAVSRLILPYIEGRPLALLRCPEGDRAKCFFQKQRTPGMPDSIHQERVGKNSVLYIKDVNGLLSLVQFGAVELHAWGSLLSNVHRPDWLVMDLDPAPDIALERTLDAAESIRELLRTVGLESFPKTTGGKGLHVVAPISPRFDFDDVKELTRSIAERLAHDEPKLYTSVMSKQGRTGKVFIDYLRNGEGATAVAPYSARARPGSAVSTPISWTELRKIEPLDFTVKTLPGILKRRQKDPWASFLSLKQNVPDALGERHRPRKTG
jgi:bifunctional non-homologous end joining protein LigD